MRVLLFTFVLFLTACSTTRGLSFYSFTNSEVETALREQLPNFSEKASLMGMPVQFDINDLKVSIGPDNRDVVALEVDASAEIKAFIIKYQVLLTLQVEGSPFYDSQKKAVFIRNVKLLDSSIDAAGFKGNFALLDNEAMNIINSYLAVNPVYKLDLNDPKIALLSKLPLDMQVIEGAIKLVPRL
jgi:hypothetical protein